MFLKFSISFLFCILAVSCMNAGHKRKASHSAEPVLKTEEELEDEKIIETAFENCKKWITLNMDITLELISEFAYYGYMGDKKEDWNFIATYLEDLKPNDQKEHYNIGINLELFTKLFKEHCKKSGVLVKHFAEEREAAVKRKDVLGNPVNSLELVVVPDRGYRSE
ncbi:uncharacterized protein LOC126841492 [Adelges cooleyi]|uniref:uncharacterized protein LOC126841492 n=1 Tax=Adelges cooleyi TaxID=133065 RepID=UPI0021800AAF|nr:uncharacterized protein LOC126841492 [Adelges cooleyi]